MNSALVALIAVTVLGIATLGWSLKPRSPAPAQPSPAAQVAIAEPSSSPIPVADATTPSPVPTSWPIAVAQSDLPNALNPGTCIRYSPIGPATHLVVFLDAGHGGVDSGAVGTTSSGTKISEAAATLAVELRALDLLRNAGYGVVVSRTTDTGVAKLAASDYTYGTLTARAVRLDALARAACANTAKADALVAIHFNADSSTQYGGVMTIFDDARSFTSENFRLATLVQTELTDTYQSAGLGIANLGTVADSASGTPALTARGAAYGHLIELGPQSSGWVDHPSAMPGILVEALHLSRPAEADFANGAKGQSLIASALVAGIEKFLGSGTAPPVLNAS
jgi:N-acetylmuramoyl-L-alanine amidase